MQLLACDSWKLKALVRAAALGMEIFFLFYVIEFNGKNFLLGVTVLVWFLIIWLEFELRSTHDKKGQVDLAVYSHNITLGSINVKGHSQKWIICLQLSSSLHAFFFSILLGQFIPNKRCRPPMTTSINFGRWCGWGQLENIRETHGMGDLQGT